jgi:hypothetical protein
MGGRGHAPARRAANMRLLAADLADAWVRLLLDPG